MTSDRTGALEALLADTEAAHGAYETAELNGVYDSAWAQWYADYAVGHGVAGLLGRAVTPDELARLLAATWDEFERADPKPSDGWQAFAARRLAGASAR